MKGIVPKGCDQVLVRRRRDRRLHAGSKQAVNDDERLQLRGFFFVQYDKHHSVM